MQTRPHCPRLYAVDRFTGQVVASAPMCNRLDGHAGLARFPVPTAATRSRAERCHSGNRSCPGVTSRGLRQCRPPAGRPTTHSLRPPPPTPPSLTRLSPPPHRNPGCCPPPRPACCPLSIRFLRHSLFAGSGGRDALCHCEGLLAVGGVISLRPCTCCDRVCKCNCKRKYFTPCVVAGAW